MVVQFNLDCALAILCLWDLDWWNFYRVRVRLRREHIVLVLVQLLDVLNLAVIGSDLQVNWYWCWCFVVLLSKVSEESIGGTSISTSLWNLFNLYLHLLLCVCSGLGLSISLSLGLSLSLSLCLCLSLNLNFLFFSVGSLLNGVLQFNLCCSLSLS